MIYTNEDLRLLEKQEQFTKVEQWNDIIALQVGISIAKQARKYDRGILVQIIRESDGMICFQYTMDDKTSRYYQYVEGKYKAIHYFGHSSAWLYVKKMIEPTFEVKDAMYSGGAFPIYDKNNVLVASILVSGLHDGKDHTIIIDALNDALGCNIPSFQGELR